MRTTELSLRSLFFTLLRIAITVAFIAITIALITGRSSSDEKNNGSQQEQVAPDIP